MKKLLLSIAALMTLIATYSVIFSGNETLSETDLFTNQIEALANDESESWWDSKVYKCTKEDCSKTLDLIYYQVTAYGKYEKCEDGSDVAHCWNCANCDAQLI